MNTGGNRKATKVMLSVLAMAVLGGLCSVLPAARADSLLNDGGRVLFIGNSYTFFHGGLPRHLRDACAAAEDPLEIETAMVTAGGQELQYLFESTDAVDRIRTGNWDIVILQGGFNAPIIQERHEQFKDSVRRFHEVITESGATPVIWAVWEQKGHRTAWNMWQRIDTVTREVADELDMPVIPVGTIWARIRREGLEGVDTDGEDFLYQDSVHPTRPAVHMNTLIFYSFLTGRSCVDLDFTDRNGEFKDPAVEEAVKDLVWEVVQEALASDEDEDEDSEQQ